MNHGVLSEGGRAVICDALLLQLGHELRVEGGVGREGAPVLERAADLLAGDHDVEDAAVVGFVEELAIGDVAAAGPVPRILEQRHEREHQQKDDDPQGEIAEVGVH